MFERDGLKAGSDDKERTKEGKSEREQLGGLDERGRVRFDRVSLRAATTRNPE